MLSSSERQALAEIESWFETHDRRLTRRFERLAADLSRSRFAAAAALLVGLLVAVAGLARVTDGAAPALTAVVIVATLVFSWWASRQPGRREAPDRARRPS